MGEQEENKIEWKLIYVDDKSSTAKAEIDGGALIKHESKNGIAMCYIPNGVEGEQSS